MSIRLGNQIRLTAQEIERFEHITGFAPEGIRTVEDLNDYVKQCKEHYWGNSNETRFLHFLIDKEQSRCLGGQDRREGFATGTLTHR